MMHEHLDTMRSFKKRLMILDTGSAKALTKLCVR